MARRALRLGKDGLAALHPGIVEVASGQHGQGLDLKHAGVYDVLRDFAEKRHLPLLMEMGILAHGTY
jgi:hypothetical protein